MLPARPDRYRVSASQKLAPITCGCGPRTYATGLVTVAIHDLPGVTHHEAAGPLDVHRESDVAQGFQKEMRFVPSLLLRGLELLERVLGDLLGLGAATGHQAHRAEEPASMRRKGFLEGGVLEQGALLPIRVPAGSSLHHAS